jgi:hypothetical protein
LRELSGHQRVSVASGDGVLFIRLRSNNDGSEETNRDEEGQQHEANHVIATYLPSTVRTRGE